MQQYRIKRIRLLAQPDRNMSNKMASKAKKQAEAEQTTSEVAEVASLDAAQQTIKTLMKLTNGIINLHNLGMLKRL